MSETKLLPCPFCGGKAKLIENNHYADIHSVMCKNCFTDSDRYYTEEEAIRAWNTRNPMDDIVEQLEKEFKKYYGDNWDKAPYLVKAIDIVRSGGKG